MQRKGNHLLGNKELLVLFSRRMTWVTVVYTWRILICHLEVVYKIYLNNEALKMGRQFRKLLEFSNKKIMKAIWICHTFCLWPSSHFLSSISPTLLPSLLPYYFLCDPRKADLMTHFASLFGSLMSYRVGVAQRVKQIWSWPFIRNFLVLHPQNPPLPLA